MNFAIPFSMNFNYADQDIQWNIKYKPKITELDSFIKAEGKKRINFIIRNIDFNFNRQNKIFKALNEKYPDTLIVMCLDYYQPKIEELLSKQAIPHYYNEIVNDWDRFHGFLSLDITDIFIGENILFNIKKANNLAKKYNKKLRCFCNLCQSSWNKTPSLKTFFIRPEDLYLYNNLIDTFEFYASDDSINKINTLYKIYTKDKEWFGKLNELIVGYEGEEDSRFILPLFGEKRLTCDKKCFKNLPPVCKICDNIVDLSETLKDAKLMIAIDK